MILTFFPTVYNFSIDGEKLFLQFLLVIVATSVIYIACRSMRIVERQYKKTFKKIAKLRARMEVVLASNMPMCENLLYHNTARYHRSLVAAYLRDLANEKSFEHDKFSNFFQDVPENSSNKPTFSCTTASENFDSIAKLDTHKFSGEESPPEGSGFDEVISSQKMNITQNNYRIEENKAKGGRKNELRLIKSPLEAKLFRTVDGRRLRSSLFDRKRHKISKLSMFGLKSAHDRCNDNVTVYTAITETMSPFKIGSSEKIQLAFNSSSSENQYPEMLNSNVPSEIGDKEIPREDKKQETHIENEKSSGEGANIWEDFSVCSVGSSGCESDCESEISIDQSSQMTFNNENVRLNTPLTPIKEESAEENCPSE